ncbi:MAG TPA: RNA polymerase sigma factor [Longimicrobiales bacterium]
MGHERQFLREPEERVGNVSHTDLPPPATRAERDEEALIAQIREHDERTFRRLLDEHYSPMMRVARRFVRSFDEAEEVIQDTWLAVLKGIDRFQARSSFKTWLYRILVNLARSRGKRSARTVAFSQLHGFTDRAVSTDASSPEQQFEGKEMRRLIENAIAALPERQQLVISMRDMEGRSADEVSTMLKLTDRNQRVLLHRARVKVRAALSPHFRPVEVSG